MNGDLVIKAIMCGTCETEMVRGQEGKIVCPGCGRVATNQEIQCLLEEGYDSYVNGVIKNNEWNNTDLIRGEDDIKPFLDVVKRGY